MRDAIYNSIFSDKRYVLCLLLSIMALGQVFLSDATASATRDATVVWSVSPEEDVAGYNIHYGATSRYSPGHDGYDFVENLEPGEYEVEVQKAEYVLAGLDSTRSYWLSVSAYDEAGNESDYSNEKHLSALVSMNIPAISAVSAPSGGGGGCQMVPGGHAFKSAKSQQSQKSEKSEKSGLIGWILLFIMVPLWILALRMIIALRVISQP